MLKIAILISGQIRNNKKNIEFIDNFFRKSFDVDIYVSTWNKRGISIRSEKRSNNHSENLSRKDEIITHEYLKDVYKTNYVKIDQATDNISEAYEGTEVPEELKIKEPLSYKGAIPMFFKMKDCFSMKKGYHDIVLRIRPDFYLDGFYNELHKEMTNFQSKTLFSESYTVDKNTQLSDKFAFGDNDVMKHYSSVWDFLKIYWKKINYSWEEMPVGERLMKKHMGLTKCHIKYLNLPFKIDV